MVGYEWLTYETCSYLKDVTDTAALCCWFGVLFFIPQWFSDFGVYQNHVEGFLNRFPRPTLEASDSAGLGWGLRMCISNKLPGEDELQIQGQHSENCLKQSEGHAPWGQALSCFSVSHHVSWALLHIGELSKCHRSVSAAEVTDFSLGQWNQAYVLHWQNCFLTHVWAVLFWIWETSILFPIYSFSNSELLMTDCRTLRWWLLIRRQIVKDTLLLKYPIHTAESSLLGMQRSMCSQGTESDREVTTSFMEW